MKIKNRQEQGYGCGVYAVANLFGLSSFVTEERLEQSMENGNTFRQLEAFMREDGIDYVFSPLWHDNQGGQMPEWIKNLSTSGVAAFPFFVTGQRTEKSKMHIVACWLMPSGNVYVLDSLKKDVQCLPNMAAVQSLFDVFVSVYTLSGEAETEWVFFRDRFVISTHLMTPGLAGFISYLKKNVDGTCLSWEHVRQHMEHLDTKDPTIMAYVDCVNNRLSHIQKTGLFKSLCYNEDTSCDENDYFWEAMEVLAIQVA